MHVANFQSWQPFTTTLNYYSHIFLSFTFTFMEKKNHGETFLLLLIPAVAAGCATQIHLGRKITK